MTQDAPCPIFFKTHCPNLKKGCKFHHRAPICPQGRACGSQHCDLRHPPICHLYAKGWCGFIDIQNIPRKYKFCSYFHNQNVPQIPPTPAVNPQRDGDLNNLSPTRHDIRREAEVETVLLVQRGGSSTQENLAPTLSHTSLPCNPLVTLT